MTDAGQLAGEIKTATDAAAAAAGDAKVKVRADVTGTATEVKTAIEKAKAEAEAAGIALHIKADVDGTKFTQQVTSLAKDSGDSAGATFAERFKSAFGGGGGGGILASIGSVLGSSGGIAVGLPVIGSLTSSIESLAGVLPIAGAGMAVLVTAGAALKIGLTDVTATVQAFYAAQDATIGKTAQLASANLASANSLIAADEAVKNARQAVTDAQRSYDTSLISSREALAQAKEAEANTEVSADTSVENAAKALQNAEDSLTTTKRAALTAEQNLTDARVAATRALEDAPNKVIDATLAQKQAVLDLQNASTALFAPQPSTGAPANAQALGLAYQQAKQRVDETTLSLRRAQEDADKLTDAGVDGAKQVVSAQDQLTAAQKAQSQAIQAVQDAQEASAQAQVAAEQSVANAKQHVTDADRALSQTIISGDESVKKSKQSVEDAIRAQTAAIAASKAAAESAAGSLATYQAMLARLAPNAQDAVRAITGMHDAWENLQNDVQQHLFAGVGDDIRRIGDVFLPVARAGLDKMADSLNAVVREFASWLTSKDAIRDFGTIFDNVASAVMKLAPSVKPVMQIITDLLTVASSFLPGFSDGFSRSAQGMADFIRNARDSGKLKEWMQSGVDTFRDLWNIGKNILGVFHDLAQAAGPFNVVSIIEKLTGLINWLVTNIPFLIPIVEAVFGAMAVAKILQFAGALGGLLGPWGLIATAAIVAVQLIIANWGPISGFFEGIGKAIAGAFMGAWNWLRDNWPLVLAILTGPIGLATLYIIDHWTQIRNGISGFIDWLQGVGGWMWNGIVFGLKVAANSIIDLFNNLVINPVNIVISGLDLLPGVNLPHVPFIQRFAAGGIGSGLALVGEQGPELVRLPRGSTVSPAANTQGMLGQATGAAGRVALDWSLPGGGANDLERFLFDLVRRGVRVRGGNVQSALGA